MMAVGDFDSFIHRLGGNFEAINRDMRL
jgi:hypothetical protein